MFDVKSPKCLECDTRPSYNVIGETKGIYCVEHKKENMFNVVDKKCLADGCYTRPNYNIIKFCFPIRESKQIKSCGYNYQQFFNFNI
jgi:hypothetical protein